MKHSKAEDAIIKANYQFLMEMAHKTIGRAKEDFNKKRHTLTNPITFTHYKISKDEFSKFVEIIKKENLLLLPFKSNLGFIEGFQVLYIVNPKKTILLMAVGIMQLPIPPKEVFYNICHSDYNKILANIVNEKLLKTYEDYYDGYNPVYNGIFLYSNGINS